MSREERVCLHDRAGRRRQRQIVFLRQQHLVYAPRECSVDGPKELRQVTQLRLQGRVKPDYQVLHLPSVNCLQEVVVHEFRIAVVPGIK